MLAIAITSAYSNHNPVTEWVYIVALIVFVQVAFLLLQNYFGPAFFLPRGVSTSSLERTPAEHTSSRSLVPSKFTIITHPCLYLTLKHQSSPWETALYAWMLFRSIRR